MTVQKTTLPLSMPIQAHGNTLLALSLRLPTGKDLRICGLPYKLAGSGEMMIETGAMHRMIAALAEVPPSAIDQIAAADWNAASMLVLGFITGLAETAPAAPETAPTGQA